MAHVKIVSHVHTKLQSYLILHDVRSDHKFRVLGHYFNHFLMKMKIKLSKAFLKHEDNLSPLHSRWFRF